MKRLALAATLILATLSASVGSAVAQETVVVSNRVIYPGETVTSSLLEDVPLRRQLRNPAAVVHDMDHLVGKIARRTILPGRLIPVNSVREAHLVETGKAVQVHFVHGPLEITVSGVPLQSGAAGDMVRVRNADTGTVFNGVVMEDGSIRLPSS
jgi:flagellar basal body P-ring formation protein FlgA